jgi:hypothetical protein
MNISFIEWVASSFNYGNMGVQISPTYTGVIDLLKNIIDTVIFTQYINFLFIGIAMVRMLDGRHSKKKNCFFCQADLEKNRKSFTGSKEKIH